MLLGTGLGGGHLIQPCLVDLQGFVLAIALVDKQRLAVISNIKSLVRLHLVHRLAVLILAGLVHIARLGANILLALDFRANGAEHKLIFFLAHIVQTQLFFRIALQQTDGRIAGNGCGLGL